MAKEVFISYSRKDYAEVRKIKASIDKELGIECWMDITGIESDAQFVDVIVSAINSHEVILFMMSANSMISKWTRNELALAERNKKRIVLIDIDGSRMSDDFYLLYNSKQKIQWSNNLQRNSFYDDLRKWINGIQKTSSAIPLFTIKELTENYPTADFVKEEDRRRYVMSLQEYAEQGNVWAQRQLGKLYWTYDFLSSEYHKAEEWLRKAAIRGDAEAQYELGHHYWFHNNMDEAKKWCSMAAAQGHVAARNRLKHLYK